MMHLIWTILIGFVVGLVARAVMPGTQTLGFLMTAVLGILGSVAASFLGQFLHLYGPGEVAGFIVSVIGAVVLLAIYGAVSKRKS